MMLNSDFLSAENIKVRLKGFTDNLLSFIINKIPTKFQSKPFHNNQSPELIKHVGSSYEVQGRRSKSGCLWQEGD